MLVCDCTSITAPFRNHKSTSYILLSSSMPNVLRHLVRVSFAISPNALALSIDKVLDL